MGRVPLYPSCRDERYPGASGWESLEHIGPITRSAADAALMEARETRLLAARSRCARTCVTHGGEASRCPRQVWVGVVRLRWPGGQQRA